RRKLSCRDSNSQPFDHESGPLPMSYPGSQVVFSSLSNCGLILAREWNYCERSDLHAHKKTNNKKQTDKQTNQPPKKNKTKKTPRTQKKKEKKVQAENEWSNVLLKSSRARKMSPSRLPGR
ncbi:hypothetical protein, partial [Thiolapillus sp.]|uniref:hypothetical protein n=1 Tax=Thiolapillus sp. TaxID=2017437 RepID=UPI003AF9CC49